MARSTIRTRRWTRAEYGQAIEAGLFHEDEPIELLAGHLVVAEPKHRPHALATTLVAEALRRSFGSDWSVQVQDPIALDRVSEPEPDGAVVRGGPRDYPHDHPAHPVLVVEVAQSSLGLDRGLKAQLYARAGVPEYWIVNLVDRTLEVHRQPSGRRRGQRPAYADVQRLSADASVTPLGAPATRIAVADLLP
jgi:Uma2 family endonuclease